MIARHVSQEVLGQKIFQTKICPHPVSASPNSLAASTHSNSYGSEKTLYDQISDVHLVNAVLIIAPSCCTQQICLTLTFRLWKGLPECQKC